MLRQYGDDFYMSDPVNVRATKLLNALSRGQYTRRNRATVAIIACVLILLIAGTFWASNVNNANNDWAVPTAILIGAAGTFLYLWIGLGGLDWMQRQQLARFENDGAIQKIDTDFKVWFDGKLIKASILRFAYEQYRTTGPDFVALMAANLEFREALAEDEAYQAKLAIIIEPVLARIASSLQHRQEVRARRR